MMLETVGLRQKNSCGYVWYTATLESANVTSLNARALTIHFGQWQVVTLYLVEKNPPTFVFRFTCGGAAFVRARIRTYVRIRIGRAQ